MTRIVVRAGSTVQGERIASGLTDSAWHVSVVERAEQAALIDCEVLIACPDTLSRAGLLVPSADGGRRPKLVVVIDCAMFNESGTPLPLEDFAVAGIHAVVDRDDAGAVFATAVRNTVAGSGWVSPHLVPGLCNLMGSLFRSPPPEGADRLTSAEFEVFSLVARGWENQEIARTRQTSEQTVKGQVGQVMRKLGCRNRGELIIVAHRGRLYDQDEQVLLDIRGPLHQSIDG